MSKEHLFKANIVWTGNKGTGTNTYNSYSRNHSINIQNKEPISASADPVFMGDGTLPNPEDFLLSAVSTCHMLWYLHLCADAGIIVTKYTDNAEGILTQNENGSGKFTSITLHPRVTITDENKIPHSIKLHEKANEKCFIANSLNFKISHDADSVV